MKSIFYAEDLLRINTCGAYTLEEIRRIMKKSWVKKHEILDLDIPTDHKLWAISKVATPEEIYYINSNFFSKAKGEQEDLEYIKLAKKAFKFYALPKAEKLYPDVEEDGSFRISSYLPILEGLGDIVCDYTPDADYGTGTTFCIIDRYDHIGLLVFGYGSCEMCDALMACDCYEDVDDLISKLFTSIRWFKTPEQAINILQSSTLETQWFYHAEGFSVFVTMAIEALEKLQ